MNVFLQTGKVISRMVGLRHPRACLKSELRGMVTSTLRQLMTLVR